MQVIFYIYENANIEKAHEISPPCAHYFTFSLNFEATNQYHTKLPHILSKEQPQPKYF